MALSSAVYTPAAESVTLTPSAPLRLNTFWRITIDGQTNTLLNNGLTDSSNNLLDGFRRDHRQSVRRNVRRRQTAQYADGARTSSRFN